MASISIRDSDSYDLLGFVHEYLRERDDILVEDHRFQHFLSACRGNRSWIRQFLRTPYAVHISHHSWHGNFIEVSWGGNVSERNIHKYRRKIDVYEPNSLDQIVELVLKYG
jgi:hypothetical protein